MAAKPLLRFPEFGESGLGPHRRGCGVLPLPKLFEHRGLRRLATVKFEADGSQPRRRQPFVHDVQRRHLLSDEQNGFPAGHRTGDYVGNGLRLPCARGTLDHEVLAGQNLWPAAYDPVADVLDDAETLKRLAAARSVYEACLAQMPDHADFIARNCAMAAAA